MMLPLVAGLIIILLAIVCFLVDAARDATSAPQRLAARAEAACALAAPGSILIRREHCPICEYLLPPEDPCPECGNPSLRLPFPPGSPDQLADAFRTLAQRHASHAVALMLALPATLVPFVLPGPRAALAVIPAILWIAAALFIHARPSRSRALTQRTTLSFTIAMLGPLALVTLAAALPLFPTGPNANFPLAPNPAIFFAFLAAQIGVLITAAQFQLVSVDALRGLPHKGRLAASAAVPISFAFGLFIPGIFFLGGLWFFIAPLSFILLPLIDRALRRECLIWERSARAHAHP